MSTLRVRSTVKEDGEGGGGVDEFDEGDGGCADDLYYCREEERGER